MMTAYKSATPLEWPIEWQTALLPALIIGIRNLQLGIPQSKIEGTTMSVDFF